MSLISELKRRNVFRMAAGYLAVSWLLVQVIETLLPIFGFSENAVRYTVIALAVGFIPALVDGRVQVLALFADVACINAAVAGCNAGQADHLGRTS